LAEQIIRPIFPIYKFGNWNYKDARGNALSNILAEVRDGDNNPVRHLKQMSLVDCLGHSSGNGNYTIELKIQKPKISLKK